MTLARIIWNNARQRRLSTALTSLSVAVGVALMAAILTIKIVSQERLRLGYSGYDLVVGAKGSSLQLVLNVVYHLDASPGNVPFSLYEKLAHDPRVKAVVPIAVGDNYAGFRIVGTSDAFFKDFEPRPNQPFELAKGRIFHFSEDEVREAMKEAVERGKGAQASSPVEPEHEHAHAEYFEAVLGAAVAEGTGLQVGDAFVATHGLRADEEGEKHERSPWTVVGILKATGTPADRAIYINLGSFYHIEGHVIETKAGEKGVRQPEIGEISALVLKARSPISIWGLRKDLNNREDAQAAVPSEEIRKLLTIVGHVDRIFFAQAALIVLVSALGTGLALFNSMNDRRRDIAIMRALGARRRTIVSIIVGEAVLISALGGLLGLFFGHLIIQAASPALQTAVGFSIPAWTFQWFEPVVFAAVLVVGLISGIGPAMAAYRTDVATNLTAT